jgi:hypothetical protein
MRPLVISPNAPLRHRSPARPTGVALRELSGTRCRPWRAPCRGDPMSPALADAGASPLQPDPSPDRSLLARNPISLIASCRPARWSPYPALRVHRALAPAVVAAEAVALGVVMHRSPAQRPERVARVLGLPQSSHAVFRLCVGWPRRPCPCRETISPANETQDETSDPAPC